MNPITWVEIPVTDMDRAVVFYNKVFGWDLKPMTFGEQVMAWFPSEDSYGCSGSLVKHEAYVPGIDGAAVYFACDEVGAAVDRVRKAGGNILQEKKLISEDHGFMGLVIDSEGNRIALHSRK